MKNNTTMTIALALKKNAPFAHPWRHSVIAFKSLTLVVLHFEAQLAIATALPKSLLARYIVEKIF